MTGEKTLFTFDQIEQAVAAMAEAINRDISGAAADYALVGIYQQGVPLARRLCDRIGLLRGESPDFGRLDISMYRDDFGTYSGLPLIRETSIPFDVNGKRIILVDDVLSSGRTIRAALDALTDYGRPELIRLAVLVDRGNPEFPIRADYTGFEANPPAEHKVVVRFEGEPGIFETEWKK